MFNFFNEIPNVALFFICFVFFFLAGSFPSWFAKRPAKSVSNSVGEALQMDEVAIVPEQEKCAIELPSTQPLIADMVGSVTLNEGRVHLYFYRSKNLVRRVIRPVAKKIIAKVGSRVEMSSLKLSDFTNEHQVAEITRLHAIEYFKSILEGAKDHAAVASIANSASQIEQPVVEVKDVAPIPKPIPSKSEGTEIVGTLISFGNGAYPNSKDSEKPESSFYVELKGKTKEFKIWGKDLERSIQDAGAQIGSRISILKRGRQPITMMTKKGDEMIEKTVFKNLFETRLIA